MLIAVFSRWRAVMMRSLLIACGVVSIPALAEDIRATYSVPVAPALKDYAQFTLKRVDMNDGQKQVRYALPADLVGGKLIIVTLNTSTRDDGFIEVHDAATGASGHCVRTVSYFTCMLKYKELGVNLPDSFSYLEQKYANDPHLAERKYVTDAFLGNAVGILMVYLDTTSIIK